MQKTSQNLDPKLTVTNDYKETSKVQQEVLRIVESDLLPMVYEQFDEKYLKSIEKFFITDYGCATGSNSIPIFKNIIDFVLTKNDKLEIVIILNDTIHNDFNLALSNIQDSIKQEFPNNHIIILAHSGSFYNHCMPTDSVHIAICSTSVHWLSHWPCTLSNHFFCQEDWIIQEDQLKIWKQVASLDWREFLKNRQLELKQNGSLIVTFYGYQKEYGKFDSAIAEVITTCLKEKNLEELSKYMSCNVYFRSPQEILEPFEKNEFNKMQKEFFCQKYIKVMKGDTAQEKAQGYCAMFKSVLGKLLISKIIENSKTEFNKEVSMETAQEIINNYFVKLNDKLIEWYNNQLMEGTEYLDYKFLLLKKL